MASRYTSYPIPGIDWLTQVQMGRVPGVKGVVKWGTNHGVSTAREDLWSVGGTYNWLTAAATLEAISTSTNDTSAGSGARTIHIYGLDANFNEIDESVTMNGTSATTATTQSFFRVYRVVVSSCGTYTAANAGTITIRVSSAGATVAEIPLSGNANVPVGSTQMSMSTVPAGHTAYVHNFTVSVFSTKQASIDFFTRTVSADPTSAPYNPAVGVLHLEGVEGMVPSNFPIPYKVPEKTDMWVQAFTDSGTAEISISYEFILVEN